MEKLEDYYKTTYAITFKIEGKDYECTGKHYYPTKNQFAGKDYQQIIVDDLVSQFIAEYKKHNKINGNVMPDTLHVTFKFED